MVKTGNNAIDFFSQLISGPRAVTVNFIRNRATLIADPILIKRFDHFFGGSFGLQTSFEGIRNADHRASGQNDSQ